MTHSPRRAALGASIAAADLDALLVTDPINVRYLSGFTGSAGALLLYPDDRPAVLATDGRYRIQAARQAPDIEAVIERDCGPRLVARAAAAGVRRLGFESQVVTVDGRDVLAKQAGAATELVRAPDLVEALREVKDAGEVALLRLAGALADAALAQLVAGGGLRPGRTERAVARELENLMFDHGADAPAFDTIVAAGANSAIPHHQPGEAVLADGDFVKIDFGARVSGYHSDMTRTFVLGRAADWQQELYRLVADAQQAGRAALRPGAALAEVDAAARTVIADAGHGDDYGHGLGHGVGLRIHEAPAINAKSGGTLLAGSVVTVEPGVYLPDRGGVRIEDTLVVGPDPCGQTPELLTRFPRELAIL